MRSERTFEVLEIDTTAATTKIKYRENDESDRRTMEIQSLSFDSREKLIWSYER